MLQYGEAAYTGEYQVKDEHSRLLFAEGCEGLYPISGNTNAIAGSYKHATEYVGDDEVIFNK
jgi:hypothetical protein